MLTPAPSVCQAPADSNGYSNLIPSTLLLSDAAWLSLSGEYNHHHQHHPHRPRSSPTARLSKLSKTTQHSRHSRLYRQHHHHDRPSRQFVATTSSSIFGDWDIDIKVDRRTLARLKKTEAAAAAEGRAAGERIVTATAAAGGGGSGGGGRGGGAGGGASITLGPGPGIYTGASGIQPLSTLPATFSSTTAAPLSTSGANTNSSTTQHAQKSQRPTNSSPNNSTTDNNTPSPPSSSASPTLITPPSKSSPNNNPWPAGGSQKKPNGAPTQQQTTTTSSATTASTPSGLRGQEVCNTLVAPSARSSFLKALGKFKSKHLQQKRSSVPLPAIVAIDTPASLSDRRASYITPPIQLDGRQDTTTLTALESSSSSPEVPVQVAQVQFEDLPASGEPTTEGTSSLRIKLKNRMSSTLASMKSSSNLRDKVKAQQQQQQQSSQASTPAATAKASDHRQSAFVTFSSSSEEPHHQQQLQQGANSSNISSSTTSGSGKNRPSKNFWTFPRVRLESTQGSKHTTSFDTLAAASTSTSMATPTTTAQDALAVEDVTMRSIETEPAADGAISLHEQLEELKVEELDSDHSLDIIQPVDYEDYTQFAELPLKKRKKRERSLAAAAAAAAAASNDDQSSKRDSSVRASTDAVKRMLTLQRKDTSGTTTTTTTTTTAAADGDVVEEVVTERGMNVSGNSKKRPPSSTETRGSVVKRTGQQASEWRRSIMKSLHLGKNQKLIAPAPSTQGGASQPAVALLDTVNEHAQGSSTTAGAVGVVLETTRLTRSGSVVSTRSRSLTTSTHPALLATTIAKPRTPGLRRETLEMAMRRRRQSSVAARSNISDTDIPPLPRSSNFFNLENISTTNVTHTFTSFTLELADMYAREVVNNSATPGLFNFKSRQSRLSVSSHVGMDIDTDHDFRGFESDGDAISGYTGDADVSMEEIYVRPKTPTTPKPSSGLFKTRARESNASVTDMFPRRKNSSIDGDSDTVPELPTLMIRTRDLNRSSGGYSSKPRPVSGSSFEMDYDQQGTTAAAEASSPRSPRRTGAMSPAFQRKTGRGIMTLNSVAEGDTSASDSPAPASAKSPRGTPMSMEEVVSWKPRNMYSQQHARPFVPTLDTNPLKPTRGSGLSSSTTLVPSSRTPHSAAMLSQSPRALSPDVNDEYERNEPLSSHHQQFSSSSSSSYRHHQQNQASADTLVPTSHLKNGSNMSTGSEYSGRTLSGYGQQLRRGIMTMEVEEFDPSEEFPPTTPADLKSLDFEALLATAEREHQKGWEDLKLQKKVAGQPTIPPVFESLAPFQQQQQQQAQPSQSFSPIQPLKIATSASKASRQAPSSSQQQLAPPHRSAVAFDLGPSDDGGTGTGTGTGSDRSMRSKRVMKKKMSVIRLTGNGNGNIQGRREDDGVIRVSMSPTPYSSSPSPSPLMMYHEQQREDPSTSRSYSPQQWRQ